MLPHSEDLHRADAKCALKEEAWVEYKQAIRQGQKCISELMVTLNFTYDLSKEFPMITLRNNSQTVMRAIDEILWIWQKKSNNIKDLNSHIWDSWADENGSIGKAYGYQMGVKHKYKEGEFDMVDRVLFDLKNNLL